jgi:hypothetical protein
MSMDLSAIAFSLLKPEVITAHDIDINPLQEKIR